MKDHSIYVGFDPFVDAILEKGGVEPEAFVPVSLSIKKALSLI